MKSLIPKEEATGEIFNLADFVFILKDLFKWTCVRCCKKSVTSADIHIWNQDKKLDFSNVFLLCRKCGKDYKKDQKEAIQIEIKKKIEELRSQIPELIKNFDPTIYLSK